MRSSFLILLLAPRFDCVCVSYSASGSCPVTETTNQDNCCANFPTMVGSFDFDVDGEKKQCDCCCSSCPEPQKDEDAFACTTSIGEDPSDIENPRDTVCRTDDDCAEIPAGACCGVRCNGGTCSAMRCEANQCQQCASAADCPTPSDQYCFYDCADFSGDGEANKCMLACQGGGLPVRPPPYI